MTADGDPALHRMILWAQRRAGAVPAPLRRMAGRALARVQPPGDAPLDPPSEDWTVPLLPGRPSADVEALAAVDGDPAAGAGAPEDPPPPGAPLRCLIATDVLDVGGMDEFVGFLGRRLPGYGVQTVVAYAGLHQSGTTGEGGRVARALQAEGVATVQLSAADAAAWLQSWRPDVVSAHGAPDWLLDAVADAGIPWVETLHGMHTFLHPSSWEPETGRSRLISAQVAVSELVRRQYLARIPSFAPQRLVTIPNGVDERRISRVDRDAARSALGLGDEYLFLSLSRYCLQKNVYGLVSAFTEVASEHPDAHLLVAGRADDARYYDQVRTLVNASPYADRIHLRGHCGNAPALLAAADAFVLDSFFEGWSLATMEALACGVPLVMSDVGGAREQIRLPGPGAGDRGYLVANPGGDPERVDWRTITDVRFRSQGNRAELIAAMSAMVRDRERWAGARDRLRADARADFSADRCVAQHAQTLRRVAAGELVPAAG
jgi:glycosyltransferase involved in cell wall biosynthesis